MKNSNKGFVLPIVLAVVVIVVVGGLYMAFHRPNKESPTPDLGISDEMKAQTLQRNKVGLDNKVKSDLINARLVAEIYYNSNNNSYLGLCSGSDKNFALIKNALSSEYNFTCKDNSLSWAASATLPTGGYWCVDNTGFNGSVTSQINQTNCMKQSKAANVYSSPKYRFELKLPSEWIAKDGYSEGGGFDFVRFGKADSIDTKFPAIIRIYPAKSTSEMMSILSYLKGTWTDSVVSSQPAKQMITKGDNSTTFVEIIFTKDGYGYEIASTVFEDATERVKEMVSTFKFTN